MATIRRNTHALFRRESGDYLGSGDSESSARGCAIYSQSFVGLYRKPINASTCECRIAPAGYLWGDWGDLITEEEADVCFYREFYSLSDAAVTALWEYNTRRKNCPELSDSMWIHATAPTRKALFTRGFTTPGNMPTLTAKGEKALAALIEYR